MKLAKAASLLLAVTLMTTPVSAGESIWISESTSEETSRTEHIKLENIPREISKNIGLEDGKEIVALDEADAESLTSFTTINADGTKSCYSFNEPIKFIDKQTSEIKFIDNTLKKNEEFFSSTAYTNTEGESKLSLAKKAETGVTLEYGDEMLRLRPVTDVNAKAELRQFTFQDDEYEVVEYKNIFGTGAHLQYASETGGIKENIYLENYTGTNEFVFELDAKGVVPDTGEDDAITFVDETTGECVFTIEKAWAMDSYTGEYREDETHFENDNLYRVERISEGKFRVTMVISKDFLESEDTVYPVLIDPTVKYNTIATVNIPYTAVFSNGHRWYPYRDTCVGRYPTYPAESLMYAKITNINSLKHINPSFIESATINIHQEGGSQDEYDVCLYDSNTLKDVADIVYKDFIVGGSGRTQNVGDLIATTKFSSNKNYSFEIKPLFRQWLRNALGDVRYKSPDYGFMIKAAQYGMGYKQLRCEGNYLWVKIDFRDRIEDGIYFIRNNDNNKYLSAEATTAWGSDFRHEIDNNTYQRWRIVYQNEGRYRLYSERYSLYEKCLYMRDDGRLCTHDNNNTDYFYIVLNADGTYRITDCNHPNDGIYCQTDANGTNILRDTCYYEKDATYQWCLERIDIKKYHYVGGMFADGKPNKNAKNIDYDYDLKNNREYSIAEESTPYIDGRWDTWDDDFSQWVNSDVWNACYKMGASRPKLFNEGTAEDVISYIKESSYFAISTHGNVQSIDCNKLSGTKPNYVYNFSHLTSFDIEQLYKGYFSTTRCVLLSCCLCGEGRENNKENMVNMIREKGAWTVVGFSKPINFVHGNPNVEADLWNRVFTISLGNGETVNNAAKKALDASMGPNRETWGLDSVYIAGDKNQVVVYS